jgi:two-component system sensor histidine kinase/response regulator
MKDITSIKKAEESLLDSFSLLRIAGKTAKFGGWSINADTKEVTWSDEVASIHEMPVGFSPTLEQGINYYSSEYIPVISRVLQKCLENGIPFDEILQIKTSRGKLIWVRVTGLAVRDISNKIIRVQGSFQDIDEIKIAERRFQDARDYAENLIQTANAIVVGMDISGNIHTFNSTAEQITGYTFAEIKERNWFETLCPMEKYPLVWEIFTKTAEGKLPRVFENPILTREGVEKIIQWHNSEIIEHGEIKGSISFGLDVTERRLAEQINEVRLRLIQFSLSHTLDELLEKMLHEAENLTKSKIGFVHFVEEDQENLILQNWSERTKKEYCNAEGKGAHYSIAKAGVWVDCVHLKMPVIHNDYNSLPHRKGLPEGHAKVIREMVVPVIRGEKIKAILGVGNKEENYNQQDVDTLLSVANLTWDIAERLIAEQNLHEIEERFHKIFDISPIGMVLLDADLQLIQTNSSFTDFIGIPMNEIEKMKFTDVIVSEKQDVDFILKVISGELSIYSKEILFIRSDNQNVWGNVQITAIQDIDKGFPYLLAMIEDVNDRKQIDAELLRINSELKEAIETKDKFFSIIAHDLRSPFNNIIGLSDLLKSEVRNLDSKQIENFAGLISKSAGHTLQLLDNLLNWARMQQDRMEFTPGNLLLQKFVKDVVWILNESAQQKNISIHNKIPSKLIIHADENMITGIIRNLISNAIKFTNTGGLIEISAQHIENQVVISVTDTGVGISEQQIARLFNVGTNSSTRGTANEPGTGLGLILCREFVEKHGGKIWVSSKPGQGTTFYFSIPGE